MQHLFETVWEKILKVPKAAFKKNVTSVKKIRFCLLMWCQIFVGL